MVDIILRPTSDYSKSANNRDFASNNTSDPYTFYAVVDEVIADDDSSFIDCLRETVGEAFVNHGFASTGITEGTIINVQLVFRSRIANTKGTAYTIPYIHEVSAGTSFSTNSASYADFTKDFALDPATGLAWTWEAVNTLKAGYSMWTSNDKYGNYLTQFYVKITYEATVDKNTELKGIIASGITIG